MEIIHVIWFKHPLYYILLVSLQRKQQNCTLQLRYSFTEKGKEDRDGVSVIILPMASPKLWWKRPRTVEHQLGINNQLKPLISFSWDYLNLCYGHFVMVYILGNRHDHIPIFIFLYVSILMQHSHMYELWYQRENWTILFLLNFTTKVIHLWSQYAWNAWLKLGAMPKQEAVQE